MDKSREEFIVFIRQAVNDKTSDSYTELYNFLVNCFARADNKLEGRVYINQFDVLVEEAAELPRKYGYAPTTIQLYPTDAERSAGRQRWFDQMDQAKTGYITLEEWIDFSIKHIALKLSQLPKDYLGGSSDNVSKDEFVTFIKAAVDKNSKEYRELYFFLLKTFKVGDVNKAGKVDPVAFDKMIEDAAAAPRRYGLAPATSDMFKTDAERLAKRKEYFGTMDLDNNGTISFDEWLRYAYKHIVAKVATL